MSSFSSESTIHGVGFIFGSSRSLLTRIFWIIWFFLSLLGLVYYIYISTAKWLVIPDLVLRVSQRSMREFPFPAITLCSPVFAKRSIVDFHITEESSDDFKLYTREECEYIIANSHWCQYPNLYSIIVHCPEIGSKIDIVKLMNESSYNVAELFHNHPFRRFIDNNEEILSPLAQFDKILTDQGFCYTTNLQNHHVLFNEEISEDFDSYKRNIFVRTTNGYVMEEKLVFPFKDVEQWTLDDGYPTSE